MVVLTKNQALSYLAGQCGEHKTDQVVVICNGYMIWNGNDIDNMHNNNVCLVIPEWNMVIVRLGVDGNIPDAKWDSFLKMVSETLD